VVLYFQPFATIKLDRMSTAFGWTIEEVEHHVVNLIQSGNIQGRVDSQNKVRVYYIFSFSSFFLMFLLL
jgi:COP9 signalosome complex subunit 1